ncbi:MAG: hypothetical protein E2O82_07255 [Betaproteobacteria bacterium]|nr:MAG: hypothetical protein E2O82_07255 [Betaproteobacteria bacterium]
MPASALETSMLLQGEQVWSRSASQAVKGSARLELSAVVNPDSAFTAILRARVFGSDQLNPDQPAQSQVAPLSRINYLNSVLELELREFYFDINFDNSALRLGKQQVVWGQADGLKLLDVINPQDFSVFILDDFDESRIPIWMVNWEIFLPIGDLQILWIPDTSMHRLASPGATFEITAPFADIPSDVPYAFEPVNRPNHLIEDSDVGARLSLFIDGWDLTVNYLYHYDDFPVILRQITPDGLLFTPGYERTHTLGATASNAFGDFILRAEIAFNSDEYVNTDSFDQAGVAASAEFGYVIGIDWSGLTDTLFSVQLFQSILLDDGDYRRDRVDTNLTLLVRRQFLNASLNLQLLGIHHQNEKDNLLRLSADYDLTSNLTVGFFGDIFSGKADTLFGQFDRQDRLGVKISLGL